ncbi:hypothetical protein HC723_07670 [Vibrio sp. S11_S32]|nr:hypothetical protein [Vibrio sp. S11_S32]
MRILKPLCPVCSGRNTRVRTSRNESNMFQTLYCDCLNEDCLTRFKAELTTVSVIHTLADELSKVPAKQSNPLNQISLAF